MKMRIEDAIVAFVEAVLPRSSVGKVLHVCLNLTYEHVLGEEYTVKQLVPDEGSEWDVEERYSDELRSRTIGDKQEWLVDMPVSAGFGLAGSGIKVLDGNIPYLDRHDEMAWQYELQFVPLSVTAQFRQLKRSKIKSA